MIFVTGGTGLLGSHLLVKLSEYDTPVRAMYRSEERLEGVKKVFLYYDEKNGLKKFNAIDWFKGDILDILSLEEGMQGCSLVYHSAALVSFHYKDFNQLMKVNREGTANVVNAALAGNINKLCYVSSTAAIGGHDSGTVDETTKWKNTPSTSAYSISKHSAEKEVWRGIEEGLDAVIVNPCVILGPGNWDESSLTIFKTLKKGRKYFPSGSNAIVDARDVANIMVGLMNSSISGERYMCIGCNQSFKILMDTISKKLGVRPPQKQIGKSTVNFVRKLVSFFHFIIGRRSPITKETVNNLYSNRSYDNSKVVKALDYSFYTLDETIENAVNGRIIQS